jgi:CMP-N-acetylneuraminic acid synthetase
MRHESERVPGKNYRPFAGRPLFHHIIDTLLSCSSVDQVVIDTDSPTILRDAAGSYPQVLAIERPQHLRGGMVPMNDILLHDVDEIEADLYLQTHSTNPLIRAERIEEAIQLFVGSRAEHDSLFSVTKVSVRLWDANRRPVNHDPSVLLRTQDLPAMYEENSCLYLFTKDVIKSRSSRIGERPIMWEMDRLEAWDIDDELDFRTGEFLFKEYVLRRDSRE